MNLKNKPQWQRHGDENAMKRVGFGRTSSGLWVKNVLQYPRLVENTNLHLNMYVLSALYQYPK